LIKQNYHSIDKAGDFLREKRLTGGIDPSGKTNLAVGTEGSYEMSFNFIKENSTSNQEVIFYGLANQLRRCQYYNIYFEAAIDWLTIN
jgi:hypothetical protein